MRHVYRSNNSGGSWWLSDDDWKALDRAGWTVHWAATDACLSQYCNNGRYLGALAVSASLESPSLDEAIESFQNATGQDYYAPGCACCGAPHYIGEAP